MCKISPLLYDAQKPVTHRSLCISDISVGWTKADEPFIRLQSVSHCCLYLIVGGVSEEA